MQVEKFVPKDNVKIETDPNAKEEAGAGGAQDDESRIEALCAQLDAARSQAESARAQVASAGQNIRLLQRQLEYATLRAAGGGSKTIDKQIKKLEKKLGFGEEEFRQIARWIVRVTDGLAAHGEDGNGAVEAGVKDEVLALCQRFPIYQGL